jgi:Flp pilus assembly protein TadD
VLKSYFEQTKNDDLLGALFRLAQDVGALSTPDQYIEMAQALATTGYATEAERVLEGALAAKVFGEDPKNAGMMTAQRTLESVKRTAATERAAIPAADKAVAANASGEDLYKAGKTYFSAGDYAKASAALQKASAKGGVSKADDARMLEGIALSRSGRKADAGKAFAAIKEPAYADIARLWKLAAR